MTVTSVDKDYDTLTLTVVADFDTTADRVWELWADPRNLERWWGPPLYPATMGAHDLTPGGTVTYFMTSPEGERYHGFWTVTSVEPPLHLEFVDGFADDEGNPNGDLPTTTNRVSLTEHDSGTRMELRSIFHSREQMEQLAEMGMIEGMRAAIGQMDALLVGVR